MKINRIPIWVILLGAGGFFFGWLWMPRGLEGSRLSGDLSESSHRAGLRGPILAVVPTADVLYVGTRRGLYRSADQGANWSRIFNSSPFNSRISDVALDPSNPRSLIVAAGSGLFASSDGGRRWRRLLPANEAVSCVVQDIHRPKRIFVGTKEGVQVSQDWGASWTRLRESFPAGPVRAIVMHPTLADHCYVLTSAGLFRSNDGGVTWERIWVKVRGESEEGGAEETEESEGEPGSDFGDLVIDRVEGVLYLGTGRGVFLSRDEGETWSSLPTVGFRTPKIVHLLLGSSRPGFLYAVTPDGLFRFQEEGVWAPLREGSPPGGQIRTAALSPEGRQIWVGTDSGLFQVPLSEEPSLQSLAADLHAPASYEPSIQEVHRAAIRYAEVMPGKIHGWRKGAVWRNWLPKFTLNLNRNRDRTIASSTSAGKTTFSVGPEDESVSVGFGFTWDLANFIYNPDQTSIDVRSRLMVQLRQDILEEVTRLYFERQRLLNEFRNNGTEDNLLRSERSLRIEELTAQLDALTGSWFSENCR